MYMKLSQSTSAKRAGGMLRARLAAVLTFFVFTGAAVASFAEGDSQAQGIHGTYDDIALPTPEERAQLEQFAMSQGVDLEGTLKDLPEDPKAWGNIFEISLHFNRFDRQAEVYGYQLFTAFSYFVDGAGEARFAKMIDSQSPQVRQRVRDFLYYEAIDPSPKVTGNNERLLRLQLKLIFPASYSFAVNDPIFAPMRSRVRGDR
jgi:hypothetical protein